MWLRLYATYASFAHSMYGRKIEMSGSAEVNRAVSLDILVNRARAILPGLPYMENCNKRCQANRASDQALFEVHGECSDWSLYSQYIPLLAEALGGEINYKQLAEELRIFNAPDCTNADIQQVAAGRFEPLSLSVAVLDALGYVIRGQVRQYIVNQLV